MFKRVERLLERVVRRPSIDENNRRLIGGNYDSLVRTAVKGGGRGIVTIDSREPSDIRYINKETVDALPGSKGIGKILESYNPEIEIVVGVIGNGPNNTTSTRVYTYFYEQ